MKIVVLTLIFMISIYSSAAEEDEASFERDRPMTSSGGFAVPFPKLQNECESFLDQKEEWNWSGVTVRDFDRVQSQRERLQLEDKIKHDLSELFPEFDLPYHAQLRSYPTSLFSKLFPKLIKFSKGFIGRSHYIPAAGNIYFSVTKVGNYSLRIQTENREDLFRLWFILQNLGSLGLHPSQQVSYWPSDSWNRRFAMQREALGYFGPLKSGRIRMLPEPERFNYQGSYVYVASPQDREDFRSHAAFINAIVALEQFGLLSWEQN